MKKFLLDENVSPEIAEVFKSLGLSVEHIRDTILKGRPDEEIISYVQSKNLTLVTFDLDFGELFYFSDWLSQAVIVMRYIQQNPEYVKKYLISAVSLIIGEPSYEKTLVILSENRIRIRRK